MSGLWVTVIGLNKIKDRFYRMGQNHLVLQGQCCQFDREHLAVYHHEVKESRKDKTTVIKRNRDPLSVRVALFATHYYSTVLPVFT